jgi:hypothetical protein
MPQTKSMLGLTLRRLCMLLFLVGVLGTMLFYQPAKLYALSTCCWDCVADYDACVSACEANGGGPSECSWQCHNDPWITWCLASCSYQLCDPEPGCQCPAGQWCVNGRCVVVY